MVVKHKHDLRERTTAYARQIIRLFCMLPKTILAQVLGKQFLRSGTSVGANYREANRGRSKAEFIAKVGDCLKEIEETDYWLDLMAQERILPEAFLTPVQSETRELTAIFVTILNHARKNE